MAIRRVLQIDGGGIRGIIPAAVCNHIARESGQDLWKTFDLITGTSTGSILGGMLACGVPASSTYNIYVKDGARLFSKRPWYKRLLGPKYKRTPLQGVMNKMIGLYGQGPKLGDVRTRFVSTTFNGCSGRTHYQLSWNKYHSELNLIEVISWSALSAVHYFGPIAVPDYKYKLYYQRKYPRMAEGALFFDGGQGRNNCTLLEAIITCMKLGWFDEDEIHILSLGTGAQRLYKPYMRASKQGKIANIKDYIQQAQLEGVHDQIHKAQAVEKTVGNLHVYRLDVKLRKEEDKLDALNKVPQFMKYGQMLMEDTPAIFLEK